MTLDPGPLAYVAAFLLVVSGLLIASVAVRTRRNQGVDRLRRVLVDGEDADDPSLAASWGALVRAAEQAGSDTGLYATLGERLQRAGWRLRAAEFTILLVASLVGGGLLGFLAFGPVGAVLGAFVPPTLLWLLLSFASDRYSRRCDDQLPDALGQMASAMRSGHSLQQALTGIAEHSRPPLAAEFRRVLADTQVGVPLDDALITMGERVGSADLRWSIRAMLIQRRTGGRLADILEVLAEFMRDRTEVRREVRALTAEGKISAVILMALPFVVFAGVLATNAEYLEPLLTTNIGRALVLVAVMAMSLAWFLMRGIVKVEV